MAARDSSAQGRVARWAEGPGVRISWTAEALRRHGDGYQPIRAEAATPGLRNYFVFAREHFTPLVLGEDGFDDDPEMQTDDQLRQTVRQWVVWRGAAAGIVAGWERELRRLQGVLARAEADEDRVRGEYARMVDMGKRFVAACAPVDGAAREAQLNAMKVSLEARRKALEDECRDLQRQLEDARKRPVDWAKVQPLPLSVSLDDPGEGFEVNLDALGVGLSFGS